MNKLQRAAVLGIAACVALALLVFLSRNDGSQVSSDASPLESGVTLEHTVLPAAPPSVLPAALPDGFPVVHPYMDPSGSVLELAPEEVESLEDWVRERMTAQPSGIPLTDGLPEHKPAPIWRAWNRLYERLERHLSLPGAQLASRLPSFTTSEAEAVYQSGQDYMMQLSDIEEQEIAEIHARFKPRNAPPPPPGVDPSEVIELPFGVRLKDMLEPEGFHERWNARKQALLDSHREHLMQLVEPAKFEWLDNHVNTAIAPLHPGDHESAAHITGGIAAFLA